jgi:hypothetical protein
MDTGKPILKCSIKEISVLEGAKKVTVSIKTIKLKKLLDTFGDITVGEPRVYKNLSLYPLFSEEKENIEYVTLEEAVKNKWVTITEVNEGGHVPELKVINNSPENVIILDGEQLIGAKQNRTVNITILVAAKTESVIPVCCTEAGRWSYRSRVFSTGAFTYSKLRKIRTQHVVNNIRTGQGFMADQGEVWNEIDRKSTVMDSKSETHEMNKIYEDRQKELNEFKEALKPVEGAKGVVVSLNGRVICADIFDRSKTLQKQWEKLVGSYTMDAIESPEKAANKTTGKDVETLLGELKKAKIDVKQSVGTGKNIGLETGKFIGTGLVYGDSIIHVSVFPKEA